MTDLGPVLEKLGLGQYLAKFIEEGFDAWETRLQREIAAARGFGIETVVNVVDRANAPYPTKQDVSDSTNPGKADGARKGKRKYRRHPKQWVAQSTGRAAQSRVDFTLEVRDDLKAENLSFTETAKRVGEMWQGLGPVEKNAFEAQVSSAKEEYLTELARYKKTDQYREYAQYLADFKRKHPSKLDTKKPKRVTQTDNTSSESPQHPTEPRQDSFPQENNSQASQNGHIEQHRPHDKNVLEAIPSSVPSAAGRGRLTRAQSRVPKLASPYHGFRFSGSSPSPKPKIERLVRQSAKSLRQPSESAIGLSEILPALTIMVKPEPVSIEIHVSIV
ncbi:MAG: hypothetical protein Q9219_000045 [cf. Caloplaca sp. 3 TL-2023]